MSVWITAHAPPKDEYSTTTPIPMSTAGTVGTSRVALTTVPIANAWAPEDARAQGERQHAGHDARRLAVVLVHDVTQCVRADVVLQPRCDEQADEHRLYAERAEREHVDVSVAHRRARDADRCAAAEEGRGEAAEEDRPDDSVACDGEVVGVLHPSHGLHADEDQQDEVARQQDPVQRCHGNSLSRIAQSYGRNVTAVTRHTT